MDGPMVLNEDEALELVAFLVTAGARRSTRRPNTACFGS
jgi:hypothetical protein